MTEIVMEGRVLCEKYEITRLLGQGGMGAVYEARNHLGKRYAVKLLLKAEFINDQQLIQRFFREAKASAAIESEHIVEVYDTGVDPSTRFPFIIMEMLKGEDLEHTINRVGALNVPAAARVIAQAATGLGQAHAAGIVHRDIKPANIFMSMRGPGDLVVKILDFGIAKHAVDQLASSDAGLTKTGSMLGTPLYMSPEQARGLRNIDARSDIWSLGMCLYEALSGRTPWGSVDTLGDLILSICARDVLPLQEVAPWCPPELALVVHKALARDVGQRMPSAQAFVDALMPFTANSTLLTPELLTGVEQGQRLTTAPKVNVGHLSSVSAVTSSQPGRSSVVTGTGNYQAAQKKPTAMFVGIAVAAALVLGVGAFAVSRAVGGGSKKASASEQTESTESTESTSEATTETKPQKPAETTTAKKPDPTPTVPAATTTTAPEKPTTTAPEKPTTTAPPEKTEKTPQKWVPPIKTKPTETKPTETAKPPATTPPPQPTTTSPRPITTEI